MNEDPLPDPRCKHSYMEHSTPDAKCVYRYLAFLGAVMWAALQELTRPETAPAVGVTFSSSLLIAGIQSLTLPPLAALAATSVVIYGLARRGQSRS